MNSTYTVAPRVLRAALLVTLSLMLSACSAPPPLGEEELFAEANQEFESGDFTMASLRYDELLEQHPFSDLAELARLRNAHGYYLSGNYDKAIAAFNDFERLHPTSPLLPFVEYTVGMSYLDQARPSDRDMSSSENALRQFERVRDRYRGSLYGRLAEYRIGQSREKLASHELYVADYYLRTGRDKAARARYRFVLESYPDTDTAHLVRQRLEAMDDGTPTG